MMAAVATHRWKSMGVASVECECGAILHGAETLTQFPADEAFRRHLANSALEAAAPLIAAQAAAAEREACARFVEQMPGGPLFADLIRGEKAVTKTTTRRHQMTTPGWPQVIPDVVVERMAKFIKPEFISASLTRASDLFGGKSAAEWVADGDGTWEQVLTKYEVFVPGDAMTDPSVSGGTLIAQAVAAEQARIRLRLLGCTRCLTICDGTTHPYRPRWKYDGAGIVPTHQRTTMSACHCAPCGRT